MGVFFFLTIPSVTFEDSFFLLGGYAHVREFMFEGVAC